MFRNYLLTSIRNFSKSKAFTLINILGLSLSMSVCLILINLINQHYQFDNFHPNGENTYRVAHGIVGEESGVFGEIYATSPREIGKTVKEQFPFVSDFTNMSHRFKGELESEHRIIEFSGLFSDPNFFNTFGFELKEGDAQTALVAPYNVVLSEGLASKLFPDGDPLGKTVELNGEDTFVVTGISKDIKAKSHIVFDAIASMETVNVWAASDKISDPKDWENKWTYYNYLTIEDPSRIPELESVITAMVNDNVVLENDDPGSNYHIERITEIVPGKLHSNEIGTYMPGFVLVFFGVLGFIVIFIAVINYANLSVAKSISRVREVGIRKVNGARRWQIIYQFLLESVVLALLSLVGAVIFYKFLIQEFNALWIINIADFTLADHPSSYLYFFLFSLILGMITGIAPSLFLSKKDIITSLKGKISSRFSRKSWKRFFSSKKILAGMQFGFAVLVLVTLFILRDQANFLIDAKYGFDEDKIVYLNLQSNDRQLVANEYSGISGVDEIAFTSHHPAIGRSHGTDARRNLEIEEITLYHFSVDPNYIKTMGLNLVGGSEFNSEGSLEIEKEIILNETAVSRLGFESVADAIGKEIFLDDDSLRLIVKGVIEDYHWEPLMKGIRPLALRIQPDDYEFAYFRMARLTPTILDSFEEKWEVIDEQREFKGGFLDEELDIFYQFLYDISGIMSVIGILAIVITSLGLLGMVGYELQSRKKEFAMRKVLGATKLDLITTMTRSHLIMIVVVLIIAIPIAVMINNLWVYEMAYHAPLSWVGIVITVLTILVLAGITIFSQLMRSDKENPAVALSSE